MRKHGRTLWRQVERSLCVIALLLAATSAAMASEYHGVVTFGGVPVPGATVTVTQGGKKVRHRHRHAGIFTHSPRSPTAPRRSTSK